MATDQEVNVLFFWFLLTMIIFAFVLNEVDLKRSRLEGELAKVDQERGRLKMEFADSMKKLADSQK